MIDKKIGSYKMFFLPALVALIAAFFGLVFLKPRVALMFKEQKKLAGSKQELALLNQKLAALKGLDQAGLEEKKELLLAALPIEKNVPRLLAVFKILAAKSGVAVEQAEASPGELNQPPAHSKNSGLPVLVFRLKAIGNFQNLTSFLAKIEKTLPLMELSGVSLNQQDGDLFEASLGIKSFFSPLPAKLGPMDQPLPLITSSEEKIYQRLANFEKVKVEQNWSLTPSGKGNPFTP